MAFRLMKFIRLSALNRFRILSPILNTLWRKKLKLLLKLKVSLLNFSIAPYLVSPRSRNENECDSIVIDLSRLLRITKYLNFWSYNIISENMALTFKKNDVYSLEKILLLWQESFQFLKIMSFLPGSFSRFPFLPQWWKVPKPLLHGHRQLVCWNLDTKPSQGPDFPYFHSIPPDYGFFQLGP